MFELFVLTTPIRNISYSEIILKKLLKNRFFNCQIMVQSKYISLKIANLSLFFSLKRYAVAMWIA